MRGREVFFAILAMQKIGRRDKNKKKINNRISKAFQARSKSLGPGDTSAIKGGGETCPRCGGAVFHAEKVLILFVIVIMIVVIMIIVIKIVVSSIIMIIVVGRSSMRRNF